MPWLRRTILCALLGAITTVVVSAVLAFRVDLRTANARSAYVDFTDSWVTGNTKGWCVIWQTRPGALRGVLQGGYYQDREPSEMDRVLGRVPWARDALRDPEAMDAVRRDQRFGYWFDLRGWPDLAMVCSWSEDPAPALVSLPRIDLPSYPPTTMPPRLRSYDDILQYWRVVLPSVPPGSAGPLATYWDLRAVPLWPVWPGFAVNTLVYGGAWAVLLLLVPAIRGAVRRIRNQCAACGYSRTGLPPTATCPECGRTPRP